MFFLFLLLNHLLLATITGYNVAQADYGFAAFFFCMFLSCLALMATEYFKEN